MVVEAGQQSKERAGLVGDGADDRGLLAIARPFDARRPRTPGAAPADQEEAGDVLLNRLNPFGHNLEAVELGGAVTGDGCVLRATILLHLARSASRVIDRNGFELFAHDECLALREGLRVRQDAGQAGAVGIRQGQQAVINLEGDLADDESPVLEQQIVGLEDAAGLRILDGNQREVDRLIRDAMEDMPQRSKGLCCSAGKIGMQRLFGIGARLPLVADRDLAGDPPTLENRGHRISRAI